jgi:tetratricopeptide (TPR) repeat protein
VQATEDAELERRLGEAFQARLEEQFETLLKQARMQLEHGDIDLSLRSLGALKTLNPNDPRIQMLEAECFVARAAELERSGEFAAAALMYERALALVPDHGKATAGLYRVREESDRRDARSMELRQLFAAAMDAYAEDDLREARTGFARVVAADSTDREAARMLEWTDRAIAQRVGALIDQAQRFVASGLYDEAEPLIRRAEELDPNAPGLARIRAAIARERRAMELAARKAQQAKPVASGAATSTRRPRTKLGEKQLESLYQEGLRALQENRTHDAVRYWELVWSARPDYRQVETYLKREYLTLGMEAFASGQLEQAVGHWKRVLEMDPDDVRANGYLERAREQMARSQEILGEKQ